MVNYRPGFYSTPIARKLRSNATEAERRMWNLLRENFPDARFRRQVPIRSFITDFASHKERMIIEVDGGQHSPEIDDERTSLIEAEGYKILRFWNADIYDDLEVVLEAIWLECQDRKATRSPRRTEPLTPNPSPLSTGERGDGASP